MLIWNSIYIKKQLAELKYLYETQNVIKNIIKNTEISTNGMEEMELDEIYFDLEKVREKITKLRSFLNVIKQTQKYKSELIDKSIILLYNPSRVNRLLDQNLITLNDSFDNL
jgi:hypothetical protein